MIHRFLFFLAFLSVLTGCKRPDGLPPKDDAQLIHLLNERLTFVIMQDGFTPPVASRIYAYSNIAAYQSLCATNKGYHTLAGQLNGLDSLPMPDNTKEIDARIVMITGFVAVANSVVYRDSILQNFGDSLIALYSGKVGDKKIKESQLYGAALSKAIIGWSNADGYPATRKMAVYQPGQKKIAWQPTPPKYTDAIEPYWGTLRPFVIDSSTQFAEPFTLEFDTIPGSPFYNMCKEVYDTFVQLDSTRKMIARFWDDNPLILLSKGHTMVSYRQITPGGHWVNIAKIVSQQKHQSLEEATDLYLRVSLSLADAFIACWQEKYETSLLRPITFITKYIDPTWKPLLETPPFPEYTCGHSTISAAASNVLAIEFGDTVEFIDNTNDPYNLPIRKFNSFLNASYETGLSRMYGGIHFKPGCIAGRSQGLKIAELVMTDIKTLKPKE